MAELDHRSSERRTAGPRLAPRPRLRRPWVRAMSTPRATRPAAPLAAEAEIELPGKVVDLFTRRPTGALKEEFDAMYGIDHDLHPFLYSRAAPKKRGPFHGRWRPITSSRFRTSCAGPSRPSSSTTKNVSGTGSMTRRRSPPAWPSTPQSPSTTRTSTSTKRSRPAFTSCPTCASSPSAARPRSAGLSPPSMASSPSCMCTATPCDLRVSGWVELDGQGRPRGRPALCQSCGGARCLRAPTGNNSLGRAHPRHLLP